MLKTLTVWNFALLEHVQIDFGEGLNILTGETGAGKSILIDSLGAILGNRLSSDFIRTGCDWLRVEAIFTIEENQSELQQFLSDNAIDDGTEGEGSGTIIITRQLTRGGKSVILVNGCHVTLTLLRSLGHFLIDIHGQHENLALLKADKQFELVESFDSDIAEALAVYGFSYKTYVGLKEQLAAKEEAAKDYEQRVDMLHWQEKEISEAKPELGEDDRLEQDINKLSHAEKIADHIKRVHDFLDGGSKVPVGVLGCLTEILHSLSSMSKYDNSLDNAAQIIKDAQIQIQEAGYEIRDYADSLEFEPQLLDKLQSRMDVLDRIKKKYGPSLEDVLKRLEKIKQELSAIENYDDDIALLKSSIKSAETDARRTAETLTNARKKAARKLSEAISEQLTALGMPDARFVIEVNGDNELKANGADTIDMFFSANVGEELRPVSKIASGGELSRIALSIKAVMASKDNSAKSMVFDEIDTGIGGKTAQMVAERIAIVAAYKQVLCVTHLPQIAAMADVHLYISKKSEENKTITGVHVLNAGEQVNEIARMASGTSVTAAAIDNAREMIAKASSCKMRIRR